jgi:ABC-type glycerol-3-phosphate transport system permease component
MIALGGARLMAVVQRILVLALLFTVVVIFVFPFFWMISCSLKTLREVRVFPPPILPARPHFDNYVQAFTRAPLARYAVNSLIVSGSTVVLTNLFALMAAYALVFLRFRGKEIVFLVLLSPQMIAGVILLLPLFVVLLQLRMLNTYPALIVPYTVLHAPFCILFFRRYMETLPRELVEAARVDGANELWTMLRVIMPLVRPAIGTGALFCFIWSWNEFLYALIYIQKPAMRTISVGIALLESVPNFPPRDQRHPGCCYCCNDPRTASVLGRAAPVHRGYDGRRRQVKVG